VAHEWGGLGSKGVRGVSGAHINAQYENQEQKQKQKAQHSYNSLNIKANFVRAKRHKQVVTFVHRSGGEILAVCVRWP